MPLGSLGKLEPGRFMALVDISCRTLNYSFNKQKLQSERFSSLSIREYQKLVQSIKTILDIKSDSPQTIFDRLSIRLDLSPSIFNKSQKILSLYRTHYLNKLPENNQPDLNSPLFQATGIYIAFKETKVSLPDMKIIAETAEVPFLSLKTNITNFLKVFESLDEDQFLSSFSSPPLSSLISVSSSSSSLSPSPPSPPFSFTHKRKINDSSSSSSSSTPSESFETKETHTQKKMGDRDGDRDDRDRDRDVEADCSFQSDATELTIVSSDSSPSPYLSPSPSPSHSSLSIDSHKLFSPSTSTSPSSPRSPSSPSSPLSISSPLSPSSPSLTKQTRFPSLSSYSSLPSPTSKTTMTPSSHPSPSSSSSSSSSLSSDPLSLSHFPTLELSSSSLLKLNRSVLPSSLPSSFAKYAQQRSQKQPFSSSTPSHSPSQTQQLLINQDESTLTKQSTCTSCTSCTSSLGLPPPSPLPPTPTPPSSTHSSLTFQPIISTSTSTSISTHTSLPSSSPSPSHSRSPSPLIKPSSFPSTLSSSLSTTPNNNNNNKSTPPITTPTAPPPPPPQPSRDAYLQWKEQLKEKRRKKE